MKTILKHINLRLTFDCYAHSMQIAQQAMLLGQLNQAGRLGAQQAQMGAHNAMNQQGAIQRYNCTPPRLKFGNALGISGLYIQELSNMGRKSLWSLSFIIKDLAYNLSLMND